MTPHTPQDGDSPEGVNGSPFNPYRFCLRCWYTVSPVGTCICPDGPRLSPFSFSAPVDDPDNLPDLVNPLYSYDLALVERHPALHLVRADLLSGRYRDDTGTPELWRLDFLRWLVETRRLTGDTAPDLA